MSSWDASRFGRAGVLLMLPMALWAQHPTLNAPPPDKAPTPAAQEPTPTAQTAQTLSVDARLVNLPVVVRDKNGALVENLTKADFTLQVDGHVQTIRYFDQDQNLPLTLGLLVDTSQSQRGVIEEERTASTAFLDQMLVGKQDQAFVVQFARSTELLQDLTTSRPKLQAALKELDTPPPADRSTTTSTTTTDSDDQSSTGKGRRDRSQEKTTLYDATFLASDELMAKQTGRKAIILLTDGNDRGSKERLTEAIEAAQRSDTIIYGIYFKGQQPHQDYDNTNNRSGYPGGGYPGGGYPGGGRYPGRGYPGGGSTPRPQEIKTDGKKVIERMARETGGRMFEVSKKQPIADIYTEIGKELHAQYRLGYTPDKETAGDGYHQVDLTLSGADKKKFAIQTRDGYFTGK